MRNKNNGARNFLDHFERAFEFIRANPESLQVRRVVAILKLINRISTEKRYYERSEAINRLNLRLRRYTWFREMLFSKDPKLRIGVSTMGGKKLCSDDERWEWGTVNLLLQLAQYYPELIFRIRRCEICPGWLISSRPNHVCCSQRCKQKKYYADPDNKARHLATMKRNYETLKKHAQNGKSGVGLRRNP